MGHLLICYSTLNGRQGLGQRKNALDTAEDLESAMLIVWLPVVCLFFPSVCLALEHNLLRVGGGNVGGVRGQNYGVEQCSRPSVIFLNEQKLICISTGATCQFNVSILTGMLPVGSHLHECFELDVILPTVSKGVTESTLYPIYSQ